MTKEDIKNDDEEKIEETKDTPVTPTTPDKNKSLLLPKILIILGIIIVFGGLIALFIWLYKKDKIGRGWLRVALIILVLLGGSFIIIIDEGLKWG